MNLKINSLIALLLLGLSVSAQKQVTGKRNTKFLPRQKVKPLNIGDKVPNIPMDKIVQVDGSLQSANSVDFNDRLLILDFMYTTCSSCIAGLPKKDHLQRQFGDKIKIMAVIGGEMYSPGMLKRENAEYIKKFLTNKKSFLSKNDVRIPWVVENKLLNQYFPHQLVSHLVWIYKGEVVAITEQDYVNAVNIQSILDGKRSNMPVKNDFSLPVDVKTPLIHQDTKRFTGNYSSRHAAIFGAYQDGIFTKIGSDIDSVNHTRRNYIINLPVLNIYFFQWGIASGINRFLDPSSIILEVKDPAKYISPEGDSRTSFGLRQSTYICYESMGPDHGESQKEIALETINNLDNIMGLKGRYELRKVKCLLLIENGPIDVIRSTTENGERSNSMVTPDIKINNASLDDIVWRLNQVYGNPPVFNEAKYKGNVNMEFTLDSWKNIAELKRILQRVGLDLKEEERELEVFVLTEQSTIN